MRKRLIGAVCILLPILCLFLLVGCGKKKSSARGQRQALRVKVKTIVPQNVGDATEYLSTLKSRNSSVLQPEVDGQITRILVKSGDQVKAGQTLLVIDPRRQEAIFNTQEATRQSRVASVEFNRGELERLKVLYGKGIISKQALDQQQNKYDTAKADLDATQATVRQQEVQLRYFSVRAPFDGVVGDIPVRVGDRVTSSTKLTTLDRVNTLEAYISIPAERSGEIRIGTPVTISGEDGTSVATTVSFVSPRVDSASQMLLTKANVPNPQGKFRNDQTVRARIVWKEVPRPMLPVTAITRISGQPFAWVLAEEKGNKVAKQRAIRVGDIVGNDYTVLDGIREGDRVITTGAQSLTDGMQVVPES